MPALAQSDAITDPARVLRSRAQGLRAVAQGRPHAHRGEEISPRRSTLLDKLHAERPREPQAQFLKGVALADSGKTDAAIKTFQAVLGEYPELPEPHNNLAVLYAQKGEYGLARDELEAAIAAAPDYVDRLREPGRHLCAPRRR